MRIIAGKFRSRSLKTPQGMAVRPSSDRLRETLFNVLVLIVVFLFHANIASLQWVYVTRIKCNRVFEGAQVKKHKFFGASALVGLATV